MDKPLGIYRHDKRKESMVDTAEALSYFPKTKSAAMKASGKKTIP